MSFGIKLSKADQQKSDEGTLPAKAMTKLSECLVLVEKMAKQGEQLYDKIDSKGLSAAASNVVASLESAIERVNEETPTITNIHTHGHELGHIHRCKNTYMPPGMHM